MMNSVSAADRARAPAYVPPTTTRTPLTTSSVTGNWSPNCSGNPNDMLRLYADGSAMMEGEGGTWSLDGNYVNLVSHRGQRLSVYWESTGYSSARVRRSGTSQTRTIYRCS